jgi:predicted dehydrogenase
LLETRVSLVSGGTEKLVMDLARKSLVGKARARPDLVRRVLDKMRREGVVQTVGQVRDKLDVPVAMGYSSAGVVLESREADHLRPGTRVACAGAGYATHAERVWVPRNLVVPLPDGVSFEQGACATMGAIALQAVRQADIRLGDRVVVIGLGLIGNLAAQLASAHGARVLGFDLSPSRAVLGREVGCHIAVSDPDAIVDAVHAFTDGHGADCVIVAASAPGNNQPLATAVDLVRLRGKVVIVGYVGMEIPRNEAYLKEIDVRMSMSYGPGRYDAAYEERGHDYPFAHVRYTEQRNLRAFLDVVADGRVTVDPLISHRFRIENALDAYALLDSGREHLGIALQYGPAAGDVARPRSADPAASPAENTIEAVRARIGLGLLGAGSYMCGALLPALKGEEIARVGVVNRTGPSAARVKQSADFVWSGTDVSRLLADVAVHAVFIGTRHDLHASQTIAALAAGKHVFVEKPLCVDADELDQVVAAQAAANRYVQVGTNRRHSPYVASIRQAFGGDDRTDPLAINYRVNAGRIPASHWLRDAAVGGGRLIGEGVHFIDACQAIVGVPVRTVLATGAGPGTTSLAGDTFVITLTFTDGSVATILYAADGDRSLPKERVEVVGLGRVAVVDDWSAGWLYSSGRKRKLGVRRGQQKGTAEQLRVFFDALRSGRPAVPLDVTWHVQHVTLLAARSLSDLVPRSATWPLPAAS